MYCHRELSLSRITKLLKSDLITCLVLLRLLAMTTLQAHHPLPEAAGRVHAYADKLHMSAHSHQLS